MRRPVQHETVHRFDLFCGNSHAVGQTLNDDLACSVGGIVAVVGADYRAGGVRHKELYSGKRFIFRAGNVFLENQRCSGFVIKGQRLRVVGVDYHGLCAGGFINGEARNRLGFRCYHGADDTGNSDLTGFVGVINAVAGQFAVGVRDKAAIRIGDLKLDTLQRLPVGAGADLADDEISGRLVQKLQMRRFAALDECVLGAVIQQVARFCSDFTGDDCHAGFQTIHQNFARGIGGEAAVVVAEIMAAAVGQQELYAGERFVLAVVAQLCNEQTSQRGVAEAERHHILILAGDPHRLGFAVDDVISVTFEFLADVSAAFEVCHSECPVGAGHISPDDRTACSAGIAAEITQFKAAALQTFSGFGVIFVHDEGAVRNIVHGHGLRGIGFQIELGDPAALNAEALGSGLLHQLVPATVYIGDGDFTVGGRCEHTEVVDLAGGGIIRAVIDMELGVGKIISGDAVALQDRQGGFDRVEEGHRAGAACFQIDLLGDLRENDMGRHIFLRDLVAAHRNIRQEDAPCAVCGGAGGVAAVDLFNEIGHVLDRLFGGNIFLQNLESRLFIVNEDDFGGLAGTQRHGLLGVRQHIRLRYGFLAHDIDACGKCRKRCGTIRPRSDGSGVTAGHGLHRQHRAGNRFAAHGVALDDLHIGLFVVDRRNGVFAVTLSYIYVHALRRGIDAIAVRCGCLDKTPKAGRGILNIDLALRIGNVAADDLTVKVDAKTCTGETGCGPTGSFLQHDFARAARWLLRLVRRWLARYELARSIVVKE